MDAGHQIRALFAAMDANGREMSVLEGADMAAVGRMMGFGGEEFACAVLTAGTPGEKAAREFKAPAMKVPPTDYCESDGVVPQWLAASPAGRKAPACPRTEADETVQRARRSARAFAETALESGAFEHILHMLGRIPEGMAAYTVVLRPGNAEPGLYRNGEILKNGLFAETMVGLLVDQRFVANAEMVMILCAERYDADAQMAAAAFAHTLSLEAAVRNAGYTAIGAFYDKKLQTFLGTSDAVLYVGVFGSVK